MGIVLFDFRTASAQHVVNGMVLAPNDSFEYAECPDSGMSLEDKRTAGCEGDKSKRLVPGFSGVKEVAAGWQTTLFLMGDGHIFGTGQGEASGSTTLLTEPTWVPGISGVSAVTSGFATTSDGMGSPNTLGSCSFVVTGTGANTIRGFGTREDPQVTGSMWSQTVTPEGNSKSFRQIAAAGHECRLLALTTGGDVYEYTPGRPGIYVDPIFPWSERQLTDIPAGTATKICAGEVHFAAITNAEHLYTWPASDPPDSDGYLDWALCREMGYPDPSTWDSDYNGTNEMKPRRVWGRANANTLDPLVGLLGGVKDVSCGRGHTAVIRTDEASKTEVAVIGSVHPGVSDTPGSERCENPDTPAAKSNELYSIVNRSYFPQPLCETDTMGETDTMDEPDTMGEKPMGVTASTHGIFVRYDSGVVRAFGLGNAGQLGTGGRSSNWDDCLQLVPGLGGITHIAASHTWALNNADAAGRTFFLSDGAPGHRTKPPDPEINQMNFTVVPCSAGRFAGGRSASECARCPEGKYSGVEGSTSEGFCLSCPGDLTTSTMPTEPLATSASSCNCSKLKSFEPMPGNETRCGCKPGHFYDAGTDSCIYCDYNKYQPLHFKVPSSDDQHKKCADCPKDFISTMDNAGCECDWDRYIDGPKWNASTEWEQAFEDENGPRCREPPDGIIMNPATAYEATSGGTTRETLHVKTGHWRISRTSLDVRRCSIKGLCPGKVAGGGDETCLANHRGPYCKLCMPDYAPNSEGKCRPCSEAGGMAVDAILKQPLLFLLFLFLLAMPWLLPRLKAAGARLLPTRAISRLRPVMKISLGFAQVVGLVSQVYQIEFPLEFATFVDKFFMPFNINIFSAIPMQCFKWHFHQKLVFSCVAPLVAVLVLTLIAARMGSKARGQLLRLVLLFAFIIFPTLCTTIFQAWGCETFDEGHQYLYADYEVDCRSAAHARHQKFASAMLLVYPIGVPTCYLWLLFRKRNAINPAGATRAEKLALQDDEDWEAADLAFLVRGYEPQFWWWEIVECVRKLLLTGFAVLFYPGSLMQIVISLLICFGYSALLEVAKPFQDAQNNRFAQVAQWGIFFTLFFSLLLKVDVYVKLSGLTEHGYSLDLLSGLLIGCNSLVLFAAAFYLLRVGVGGGEAAAAPAASDDSDAGVGSKNVLAQKNNKPPRKTVKVVV